MEPKNEKQIQDAMIELLVDTNEENKKIMKRQSAIIVFLIVLLFTSFCYYEWSFKAFLSQYDYENTITTTTENNNDAKAFDKNNSINASISDININTDK